MALSPGDPNSHSRPDQARVSHIHLDLDIDFPQSVLSGHCLLTVEKLDHETNVVIFDVNNLEISEILDDSTGEVLEYSIGPAGPCGSKLEVKLANDSRKEVTVKVSYKTSPDSPALEWLSPDQTAGKQHPYMFSQGQAILNRSLLPCQDTPSVKCPYTAAVTAPPQITVLMSAIRQGEPEPAGEGKMRFRFCQKIPIQSYLIAVAAGAVESRKIGPRSHVWSEKEFVEKAAEDFSETEMFLTTAEELCGPYVWGVYDILVLPPSFAFGGMENPCLTFVTPTLLSGDKSLAGVIAHEIAHSWTGNLVTNSTFEHFWLNEGFTVFTERKIKGRVYGEASRHFTANLRWKELVETVEQDYGVEHPYTCLVPSLVGVDPDDAFSRVPYEKGSTFLWYLEELVGGAPQMEPFLKSYYKKFAYKSIDSLQFKELFLDYFSSNPSVGQIDWDTWLYSPGMPPYKPAFDDSLAKACWELADRWQEWSGHGNCPFDGKEMEQLSAEQRQEFLSTLFVGAALGEEKLAKMESLYELSDTGNMEILFLWIRLGIKARWDVVVPKAFNFVNSQGRMKFVGPIYKDLNSWEEKKQEAVENFIQNKKYLMQSCANLVKKNLNL